MLSGAVPSRIMPERQLCHDICSFRRSSNRREESSFFPSFSLTSASTNQGRVLLLKLSQKSFFFVYPQSVQFVMILHHLMVKKMYCNQTVGLCGFLSLVRSWI